MSENKTYRVYISMNLVKAGEEKSESYDFIDIFICDDYTFTMDLKKKQIYINKIK